MNHDEEQERGRLDRRRGKGSEATNWLVYCIGKERKKAQKEKQNLGVIRGARRRKEEDAT